MAVVWTEILLRCSNSLRQNKYHAPLGHHVSRQNKQGVQYITCDWFATNTNSQHVVYNITSVQKGHMMTISFARHTRGGPLRNFLPPDLYLHKFSLYPYTIPDWILNELY